MKLRSLAIVTLFLLACTPDEGTAGPLDPGTAPTYEGAPTETTHQTSPAAALLACNAASHPQPGACRRSERALTADDTLALGFEASAFLQLITGEHRSEVTWQADGTASGSSSELLLTVEPLGAVRFVDRELGSAGVGEVYELGNTGARYYTCGDGVAVDARLSIATADGALNEVALTTLEADSGTYARSIVRLPAADLTGSLRTAIPLSASGEPADELTLVLGISELGSGLEGSLAAHARLAEGDLESGQPCRQLGFFSLESTCPLGSFPLRGDEGLHGLSYAGALARLDATSPTLLPDTGAQLTLAFDASPAPACMSIDTPAALPSILMFPGTARLESSDGRVGGTIDVQLTAEALGGTLRRVTAKTEYLVPDPTGLSELAPSYAILQPLTWSNEFVGGFEFLVEATEQSSGGLLRAIGGNLACNSSRPCQEVCPAPGCTVTNAEKWAVRWGDLPVGDELPLQASTSAE
jgi:hypothetical protein